MLVRLYVDLPESAAALQRLGQYRRRGRARIPTTWLHQTETVNAFQQMVFLARQGIGARMTPERAVLAAAQLEDDLAAGHGLESVPLSSSELAEKCRALAQRHTARYGFRAYDIAHVASALILGCDEFRSFDVKAEQLAALAGLKTR